MKKAISLLIGALLLISLTTSLVGCSNEKESRTNDSSTTQSMEAPSILIEAIKDLRSKLKNPNSLQINGAMAYYDNLLIVIDYSAENSFGGATRDKCIYMKKTNLTESEEASLIMQLMKKGDIDGSEKIYKIEVPN